jgi:LysM repeat protein
MRVWWRLHKVESGDTLMAVARRYHTTVHAIAEANQMEAESALDPGSSLIIPLAPGRSASGDEQTYAKRLTIYHVRKGDTVQRVGDNLGIPPATIRRWNRLKGDSLAGRRVLYLHLPVSPGASGAVHYASGTKTHQSRRGSATSSTTTRHHTVKQGETLYSIASTYKTSVSAIKQTNANVAALRPGMVLVIPPQQ